MNTLLRDVRAVLATTPHRWQSLVSELGDSLLTRAPKAGEWSALECLQHIVETEREVFPGRVRAILAGQAFPAFDPDAAGALAEAPTPAALADEFAGLRAASLAELDRVQPEDLVRTGLHAELGAVTLAQLLSEWAAHDLMHTVQAERALMQPFIPGSGPWRFYFAEHDVAL